MATAKTTGSYLDPPQLHGVLNSNGTYTLSALELKALNDFNYYVAKMMQGGLNLANLNKATNQVFEDIDGNVTAVTVTAEGLTTSVSNLNNEVSTVKQTASSLSATVTQVQNTANSASSTASSAYTKAQSVELTVDGFTVSDGYGNTTINGDKIRSGTIEGVTLLSINSNNSMVKIFNGGVDLGEAPYYNMGSLYYDMNDGKVYLYSVPGRSIKIESGDGLSIDSKGTIFIGTNTEKSSGNISIGQAGGTVNLIGTVQVNGQPIGSGGGTAIAVFG